MPVWPLSHENQVILYRETRRPAAHASELCTPRPRPNLRRRTAFARIAAAAVCSSFVALLLASAVWGILSPIIGGVACIPSLAVACALHWAVRSFITRGL